MEDKEVIDCLIVAMSLVDTKFKKINQHNTLILRCMGYGFNYYITSLPITNLDGSNLGNAFMISNVDYGLCLIRAKENLRINQIQSSLSSISLNLEIASSNSS